MGFVFAAAAFSVAQAQTVATPPSAVVQFLLVARKANFVQTDPTTVSADQQVPYQFKAAVEGQGLTQTSPLTAASFTWPSGGPTGLTFITQDSNWQFIDTEFSSMSSLNSVYGTGAYTFNLTGSPSGSGVVTVSSFEGSILQVPHLTLMGGGWQNGIYVLTSGSALTVSFNAVYAGTPGSTDAFHFDAWIGGGANNYQENLSTFLNYDPTGGTALMATAPMDWTTSVLADGIYNLDVAYADVQNPVMLYSNSAMGASLLEYRTAVTIQVVPEPATWMALLAGLGLLGFVSRSRLLRS